MRVDILVDSYEVRTVYIRYLMKNNVNNLIAMKNLYRVIQHHSSYTNIWLAIVLTDFFFILRIFGLHAL